MYCTGVPRNKLARFVEKFGNSRKKSHQYFVTNKALRWLNSKKTMGNNFKFIFAHEEVFLLGRNIGEGCVKWCLQYIGARDQANKYLLCLKFKNRKDSGQQLTTVLSCQRYSGDNEQCFMESSTCVTKMIYELEKLCKADDLYYVIYVLKVDEFDKYLCS